ASSPTRRSRSPRKAGARTRATISSTGADSRRNSVSSIQCSTPACSRSSTTYGDRRDSMHYKRISADCHLDMIWLPPDLFTSNAPAAQKDKMPYVADSPEGPRWVARNGATFGYVGGVGSAGSKYVPGQHRGGGGR